MTCYGIYHSGVVIFAVTAARASMTTNLENCRRRRPRRRSRDVFSFYHRVHLVFNSTAAIVLMMMMMMRAHLHRECPRDAVINRYRRCKAGFTRCHWNSPSADLLFRIIFIIGVTATARRGRKMPAILDPRGVHGLLGRAFAGCRRTRYSRVPVRVDGRIRGTSVSDQAFPRGAHLTICKQKCSSLSIDEIWFQLIIWLSCLINYCIACF